MEVCYITAPHNQKAPALISLPATQHTLPPGISPSRKTGPEQVDQRNLLVKKTPNLSLLNSCYYFQSKLRLGSKFQHSLIKYTRKEPREELLTHPNSSLSHTARSFASFTRNLRQMLLQNGPLASISHPTQEPNTIGMLFQYMHRQYGVFQ